MIIKMYGIVINGYVVEIQWFTGNSEAQCLNEAIDYAYDLADGAEVLDFSNPRHRILFEKELTALGI